MSDEISDDGISGRYRHFKGNFYEVLGVAKHSETEEALVVYRALYGDGGWWVRPFTMFFDSVMLAGEQVPRFARVDETAPEEGA